MPRRKQKYQEKQPTNPKRFDWKQKTRHKTYQSADAKRNKLKEEGVEHVKVRRCGAGGTQFKVVVGTALEKKPPKNKKGKKKETTNESK
jgi:hypothetical protein